MSWYTGSLFDRTIFAYLRKRGWDEKRINKIAMSVPVIGSVIMVIGIIICLTGI